MSFSYLVAIASCPSDGGTKPIRNISDFTSLCGDVEGSPGSYSDSPNVRTSASKRLRDDGSNQIASLIPEVAFVPFAVTDG